MRRAFLVLRNGPKRGSYKQLTGLNLVMTKKKKKRLVMWEAAKTF